MKINKLLYSAVLSAMMVTLICRLTLSSHGFVAKETAVGLVDTNSNLIQNLPGKMAECLDSLRKADSSTRAANKKNFHTEASYYDDYFNGRETASGDIFSTRALTAAHRNLPFGTKIKVTYKGKEVIVTINDRGPYARDNRGRLVTARGLDLSPRAFKALADIDEGVIDVRYQIISLPRNNNNKNKRV